MVWKIGMPSLGHTMETGRLSEWAKSVGDTVEAGDVLGVVETEKASFDIEAPAGGEILAIYVEAGTETPVGTTLAVIGAPGEALPDAAPRSAPEPARPAAAARAAPDAGPRRRRPRASPAARALAEALGVELADVTGTGEDGLIGKEDVAASAPDAAPAARALSPMRRAIAAATSHAWATVPHVALASHADLPGALARNPRALTAATVRAAALALRDHPALNGWLTDDGFEAATGSDVGVAVAVPGGLVTITIAGAQDKAVAAIADEIAALSRAARDGPLRGAATTGASFTVSSLGRWGADAFAPVISAPQVAILGVGRVRRAAREAEDGGVRFADELGLTLVFDHRANDGVAAAECLGAIVRHLQDSTPAEPAR